MWDFLTTIRAATASIFRMEKHMGEMAQMFTAMAEKVDKIAAELDANPNGMDAEAVAARDALNAKLQQLDDRNPDVPAPPEG